MSPVLLYLLKAHAALLLFAAAYYALLRRLTFFKLNRFYLVFALLFSAAYPLLPLPALFPEAAGLPVMVTVMEPSGVVSGMAAAPVAPPIDWAAYGLLLYAGGTAVLLARLLVQLLSLWRVRRNSQSALVHGQAVRTLAGAVSPFSFWQTIYLNPARHPAPELAAVLRHEQVHVQQWHTLDVLLAQIMQALAWCNPAAWLLRRALLDNLEYLADHAALQTGLDRQAYQYSLLRLSHGVAGPSLVSHFTLPTLKNRVAMMNTPLSSTGQLARYIVAGPLVLAVALCFSAAHAQGAGPKVPVRTASAHSEKEPISHTRAYFVDGQQTTLEGSSNLFGDVATMKILKGPQVQQVLGNVVGTDWAIMVTTNQNRNRADVLALNAKVDAAGALDTHFKLGPTVDPAKHQLPDNIKAYMARTYPNAKLVSWAISEKSSAKAPFVKYLAAVKEGDRRVQLYFNEAGQPVTSAPGAPAKAGAIEQRRGAAAPKAEPTSKAASSASSRNTPPQSIGSEPPLIYIDGVLQTAGMNVDELTSSKYMASIHKLTGEKARQFLGGSAAPEAGIIIATTSNSLHRPEVMAFNQRAGIGLSAAERADIRAGEAKPQSTAYLAAPALAYITKTYPEARLLGVSEVPGVNGGEPRYQAEIVLGRRPGYLLFDAQGNFISDSYKTNAR